MIIDIDHPTAGKIKTLGIPVKLSKTPGRVQSPPPRLGQHTDQILINLGYTQDEIDRMRNEKIIQ
jgi:formyl-CoA transferase/CoA:oxalate CoA-transferase